MQRALDLLAVAEFGLVVVAIAKFRLVRRVRSIHATSTQCDSVTSISHD